jgi:hypothetical protein
MICPVRQGALRRVLRASSPACAAGLLAAILLIPGISLAQLKFTTQANVEYQNDSNTFDLAPGLAPPTGNTTERGDSYVAYGAGATVNYTLSQQVFTFQLQGNEYQYNRFTELNHDDYSLGGDWEWKIGRLFDGSIAVNRDRQMVAFSDFVSTQTTPQTYELSLQTDQNEHFIGNIHITPLWTLQGGATASRSDSPRPGQPDLSLMEDTGMASLRYGGVGALQFGIAGQYSTGTYSGRASTTDSNYHETAEQLVATYSVSPQSTFDFSIGNSKRSSVNGLDDLSGVTGHLSLQRALTGKTSIKLQILRTINSFITDAGSEIDTTGSVQLTYSATRKITVNATYGYTYSNLPNQGLAGADRIDHFQTTDVTIDYQITKWLDFQPYARFQTRTSDLPGAQFSADIYGIRAHVNWPD